MTTPRANRWIGALLGCAGGLIVPGVVAAQPALPIDVHAAAPPAEPEAAPAAEEKPQVVVVQEVKEEEKPLSPKEKDVAQAAKPTPIVPSPKNTLKPAFQLYLEYDIPLLAVGAVIVAGRFAVRGPPKNCALEPGRDPDKDPVCTDQSKLNPIDRPFAGRYDNTWALASDIGALAVGGGLLTVLVADEGALPALNDAVVIAQSVLIATALPALSTLSVGRPRPYLYSDKAPKDLRASSDASMSFISSHTSLAFATTTSTFMALRRLEPRSRLPYAVLGLGLLGSSGIAASRVMAGRHFPTDVVAGALIGSSVGVVVPALHGSPVQMVPDVGPDKKAAAIVGHF